MSDRKLQNAQRSERQPQATIEQNQPDLSKQGQVFGFGISIDMSSNTAEEAADRALSSVARKLDKSLSVEYTVNQLIAEATDPSNLAKIFAGKCVDFFFPIIIMIERDGLTICLDSWVDVRLGSSFLK